jgi:NodT family efflux transporter outer membrane factor (OMF) lipoprotein
MKRSCPLFVPRAAGLGLVTAMLAACAVGPDFVRPAPPDTDRYTRLAQPAATVAADGQAQRFGSSPVLPSGWWQLFKSAPLDAMVRQAVANNPTLQAAEASLRQSQDNLRAGDGVFYPRLDAGLGASRQLPGPSQEGGRTTGTIFNLFTLSGTISYVLDVFGGERRMVEGLQAQADAQFYASKAAYVTLTANVVDTSIARAAYAAQIVTTGQLLTLEHEQLRLTRAQVQAGTVAYGNVPALLSVIATNEATLAPLRQKVSQTEHLLATLEGVTPALANLPEIELAAIVLPTDLPVSLPSDLVRERPDIMAAEAQMHVASANIGVATAAMFPSFSLTGTFGTAGSSLGQLTGGSGKFWSVGPTVAVPLFQGGTLWYGRQAAIDAQHQAAAVYRQTVLGAFAQVADALKGLEHDAEALQSQVEARRAAAETLDLLQTGYRAGLVADLDLLSAEVQYHQVTLAYLQSVAQREQDTVALFVALGGGWWNGPVPAEGGGGP